MSSKQHPNFNKITPNKNFAFHYDHFWITENRAVITCRIESLNGDPDIAPGTIVGRGAAILNPVDYDNYSPMLGKEIARGRAVKDLWRDMPILPFEDPFEKKQVVKKKKKKVAKKKLVADTNSLYDLSA